MDAVFVILLVFLGLSLLCALFMLAAEHAERRIKRRQHARKVEYWPEGRVILNRRNRP